MPPKIRLPSGNLSLRPMPFGKHGGLMALYFMKMDSELADFI